MKIFNIEKGKEVVYVQRKDLEYISQSEQNVPKELIKRNYKHIASNGLEDEFIIFSDKETIEYFKNLNWIVDYRKFCNVSNDDIFKIVDTLFERYYHNFSEIYNDFDKEKKYSKKIIVELAQYYLNSMLSIPKLKNEDMFTIIPLVPDEQGFHYESNSICISSTLKPNWFMIYNKMGRNVVNNKIPKECLRALIAYFNGNNDINWTWDLLKNDYQYTTRITPDGKYILLKFYEPVPIKEKSTISCLARVWNKNFNK